MKVQRIKSAVVWFFMVGLVAAGFLFGSGLVDGGAPSVYASEPVNGKPRLYDRR